MLFMRQARILREYDPPRGTSVSALSYEYPAGYRVPDHAHGSDQLIYAIEGIMEVSSGRSIWTLPPQFALWLPAKTFHRIQTIGLVRMRTLYFRPGTVLRRQSGSALLYVAPLLRELIIETVRRGCLRRRNPTECALRDLLAVQLASATAMPLGLTMPSEPRALAVAQLISGKLTDPRPLAKLCAETGVGVRTAQCIFLRELGIDIDTWRRHARLTKSVQLLVAGHSVKEVSSRVGYRQSGAFVDAFRRLFGSTPKVWTAGLLRAESDLRKS